MRYRATWLALAFTFAACVTPAPPPAVQATGQSYTGQVWGWDEQRGTVTLRQLTEIVRVKVTSDQLRGLRLHETATVRGEIDPPVPIEHHDLALSIAGPRGPTDEAEIVGTVVTVDEGTVGVSSPEGPVLVWRAANGLALRVGDPVRVAIRVQPLELRTVAAVEARPTEVPSPSMGPEAGEYSAVRGRIVNVQPGRLTVDSPRGPIVVAVPLGDRYRVGDAVEVHAAVRPAR